MIEEAELLRLLVVYRDAVWDAAGMCYNVADSVPVRRAEEALVAYVKRNSV